jgi:hypothetical protein
LEKIRPDQKILPDLAKIMPDIAVYTAEETEDIRLIADYRHIMRPHLAIEIMEESDWYDKGKLSSVKRHHSVMKPQFGTFIICREPPPQAAIDELAPKPAAAEQTSDSTSPVESQTTSPEIQLQNAPGPVPEPPLDIHILEVKYDKSRLEPLIDALNSVKQTS